MRFKPEKLKRLVLEVGQQRSRLGFGGGQRGQAAGGNRVNGDAHRYDCGDRGKCDVTCSPYFVGAGIRSRKMHVHEQGVLVKLLMNRVAKATTIVNRGNGLEEKS
jgi:hypothetical protein